MPWLRVDDGELEPGPPDAWICPVCRAETAAAYIRDCEVALFRTTGEAQAEFRKLRLAAIAISASSTASARAGAGPRKHDGCSTASPYMQYGTEET